MALPDLPSPADAVDRRDGAARGRAPSRDAAVSSQAAPAVRSGRALPLDRTAADREDQIEGDPPEEDREVRPRLSGAAVVRA